MKDSLSKRHSKNKLKLYGAENKTIEISKKQLQMRDVLSIVSKELLILFGLMSTHNGSSSILSKNYFLVSHMKVMMPGRSNTKKIDRIFNQELRRWKLKPIRPRSKQMMLKISSTRNGKPFIERKITTISKQN
jgi:hypothetical protein